MRQTLGEQYCVFPSEPKVSPHRVIGISSGVVPLEREDLLRTVERYLVEFEQQLIQGQVRADNPICFNQMVRLRAFLMSDVNAPVEVINGLPSLEDLQERHKEIHKKQS